MLNRPLLISVAFTSQIATGYQKVKQEIMISKVLLLACALAAVSARPQEGHGHDHHHEHAYSSQSISLHDDGHKTKHVEYYGHPKYEFSYEVKDPHTHDIKHQHEHRDGYNVKGEYSLHQPDGTVRIVKYHADKKSGFHADVKYEGHAKHIVPEHHHHHH